MKITIEEAKEFLKDKKIHDCNNNITMFNTREWVEKKDCIEYMQQFAQMQVDKAVEDYKEKSLEIYEQMKLISTLLIFDSNKSSTVYDSDKLRKRSDELLKQAKELYNLIIKPN